MAALHHVGSARSLKAFVMIHLASLSRAQNHHGVSPACKIRPFLALRRAHQTAGSVSEEVCAPSGEITGWMAVRKTAGGDEARGVVVQIQRRRAEKIEFSSLQAAVIPQRGYL